MVRGYAVSSIEDEKRESVATRVIDHFSSRQEIDFEVQSLDDIPNSLQVVRTLLHLGRLERGADAASTIAGALFWSLESYDVYLSRVRPIFRDGWRQAPPGIDGYAVSALWTDAALALSARRQHKEAWALHHLALQKDVELDRSYGVLRSLRNLSCVANEEMRLYDVKRLDGLVEEATRDSTPCRARRIGQSTVPGMASTALPGFTYSEEPLTRICTRRLIQLRALPIAAG